MVLRVEAGSFFREGDGLCSCGGGEESWIWDMSSDGEVSSGEVGEKGWSLVPPG